MPLINHTHKIIFTHIPKNAGSSVRKALSSGKCENVGKMHLPLNLELTNKYPDYKKLFVIRNSWQAMVSMYRFWYRANIPTPEESRNTRNIVYTSDQPTIKSFADWLKWDRPGRFIFQMSYVSYINENKERIYWDNSIYLNHENLEEEFNKKIGQQTGLKLPNTKYHFYGKYNWKDYYTEETKEIINTIFKYDIEYFNFNFE